MSSSVNWTTISTCDLESHSLLVPETRNGHRSTSKERQPAPVPYKKECRFTCRSFIALDVWIEQLAYFCFGRCLILSKELRLTNYLFTSGQGRNIFPHPSQRIRKKVNILCLLQIFNFTLYENNRKKNSSVVHNVCKAIVCNAIRAVLI